MPTIQRLIPLLTYQDIPAAQDFLVRAFGFTPGGIHRTPDGLAVHAEVRAGDATIWLHRATPDHHLDSPRATDIANAGLVLQVDTSTPTTSSPAPPAPASTPPPPTNPTANANTPPATPKATAGISCRR